MNPEEYAAAQAAIAASISAYVQRVASLFAASVLNAAEWLSLLQYLFPEVQKKYTESAQLGRAFYDSQRSSHQPALDRNDSLLSDVKFQWFVENTQPARKDMSKANSSKADIEKLAMTVVREVEMAGRRQIIGAVKNDPGPQRVKGWARVATGKETCAWCLMLISRGPKYYGPDSAGLHINSGDAVDIFNESAGDLAKFRAATSEEMEQWHVGCDCLVVPVFDLKDWPGRDAQIAAEKLWIQHSKEATSLIESGKARTTNKNKETLNSMRRSLSQGDVLMSNYSLAA